MERSIKPKLSRRPNERRRLIDRERGRPTAERLRRAGGNYEHGHSGQFTMRDTPLERALFRKLISSNQYAAGQKYRHHWFHARLAGGLRSLDLSAAVRDHFDTFRAMPQAERQVFHRQRFREAMQAVGKIGSYVLDAAICRELPLEQVGNALGWGSRPQAYAAAAERLKDALDELCRLWGLDCEARR